VTSICATEIIRWSHSAATKREPMPAIS
jgi:hypothetical protein